MKPNEIRRMKRRQEQDRAARGEALEAHLRAAGPTREVVPHLIPSEEDLQAAVADVRALVRRANRTSRGARRGRVLDELMFAFARLVYVERVLGLDRLERAALTPARLVQLSRVSPEDLLARRDAWQGDAPSGLVVPS